MKKGYIIPNTRQELLDAGVILADIKSGSGGGDHGGYQENARAPRRTTVLGL